MAPAPDTTPLERLLGDPAARGAARARATREPTLIRLELPLPDADPWHWIPALEATGDTTIAWDEPSAGRTLVAALPLASEALDGRDRLMTAAALCSRTSEQLRDAEAASAPLCFTGLAFGVGDTGPRSADAPWAGWGDGTLWIPRLVIQRMGGRTTATLSARVSPGEGSDSVSARLRALVALAVGRPERPGAPPEPARADFAAPHPDPAGWAAAVQYALNSFGEGRLDKVVLARALEATAVATARATPAATFDPWATARALRQRHPACTTWAIRRPDGSAFVGATPELLVRLEGRQVTTGALAGTAPRGADAEADSRLARGLLAQAKERHEHAVVVDAVRAALAGVCEDVAAAAAPAIRRLPDVQHLETPITATLRAGRSLWDLVAALHPTPAVGGQPRDAALAWLEHHEHLDRGWYAGPIGWVDGRGDGAFHVALRSAFLRGDRAWAYAGAGLVAGSDARAEWSETEHKLDAIRSALAARGVPPGSGALP